MNQLSTQFTTLSTEFRVHEGSNYEVLMTYDTVEVISFESFKRLMKVLNDGEVQFVTINDRVRKKDTIIDIAPTNRKTPKQKEANNEIARRVEIINLELEDLGEKHRNARAKYFNMKYGKNKWKAFPSFTSVLGHKKEKELILSEQDNKDFNAHMKKHNSNLLDRIDKLQSERSDLQGRL